MGAVLLAVLSSGHWPDALAMAVKFWTDYLDRDVSREEDRRNEELFDEELRRFEETVFGYSRPPDNFYDNY